MNQKLRAIVLLGLVLVLWGGAVLMPEPLTFTTLTQESSLSQLMSDTAALYVVASSQEVDTLARAFEIVPGDSAQGGRLITSLRQVDYQQHFVVIAKRGQTSGSSQMITLRRMARRGTHVQIEARYQQNFSWQGDTSVVLEPFHVVTVSRDGTWHQPIQFEMEVAGRAVATTIHFIP
jgi:hypothetical protein